MPYCHHYFIGLNDNHDSPIPCRVGLDRHAYRIGLYLQSSCTGKTKTSSFFLSNLHRISSPSVFFNFVSFLCFLHLKREKLVVSLIYSYFGQSLKTGSNVLVVDYERSKSSISLTLLSPNSHPRLMFKPYIAWLDCGKMT